ncbi:MAG: DASS family sodium-coupled anion symporter [Bacteroidales bacterium]|nr:DASS family sodium-coupled anion symporter [Bacteroidales bacterium]
MDVLDMNNYKIEKLPKMQKSGFERTMQRFGGPLAILVFILLYYVVKIPFLEHLNTEALSGSALKRFNDLGLAQFIRANYAMLAIFVAAIILWITEAVPNYLTSLIVILGIVLTGITTEKTAYAQLGHPVMWLNILSFVLASMLVKTQVAKRFALWFVLKFGKNAGGVIFSFIIINLVLSAFISATTAKAAILLPIMMVICAIYGATGGEKRNNFGRNLMLQNLFQINLGANAFLTGSGATLLAGSLIAGAIGLGSFSYQDWFKCAFPMSVLLIFIGWFIGTKVIFPMKKDEQKPQIPGGMERLKTELEAMGKMKGEEFRAIAIFLCVLILWATDKQHGINQTAVAFLGAVVALMPKIGVVKWNDVDIPWHLLLFSAGAYTLGAGLDATGLPGTAVNAAFASIGITANTPYWALYMILTSTMLLSALIFQSKTMQTLIFVPIAIGVAQSFNYPIMSLAFPIAMLVGHVYVLPFNSKPAALLYTTNQYSWSDTFKFGITMMFISWLVILLWGQTVLHWFGYTPGFF